ncbi:MAG: acyl-CoA dehydratase activase [Fusobacteriaceae bacterium]
MENKYTLGVDIGSTASKCIVIKNGKEIIGKSLVNFGTGTSGPLKAIEKVLEESNLSIEEMASFVSTGYGRNSVEGINFQMSELSCHALGAHFLFPNARTVIDIGGQDAKALNISEKGMLVNFVMNDKCAAGTGRFLDVMAHILEVDISELASCSLLSTEKVNISSTCTVFAESEVISQLSQKKNRNDIIKGIHRAVAGRIAGLVKRIGVKNVVVMTGGLSPNYGLIGELEIELGCKIYTSSLAPFAGAIGAALFGYIKIEK